MKRLAVILLVFTAPSVWAETLVPVRTIRAKEILTAQDVMPKPGYVPGTVSLLEDLVGNEARVALYPNRPIRFADLGPPAIVERNDIVTLIFDNGLLSISTEGRALGRGAEGDIIRVMNIGSRSTLTGTVRADGSIEVN